MHGAVESTQYSHVRGERGSGQVPETTISINAGMSGQTPLSHVINLTMRGGQSKLGYCPIRGDTGIPRLRDGREVTRFPLRKEEGHDSGSAVEGLGVFSCAI